MYAYIKGTLECKSKGFIIVENNGIGYKVFMTESSINELGELGEKLKIYIHYHVREDEISLYGFNSDEELRMFELLLSVSGIGAKSAITMLSSITPSAFALAVISNDIAKLTKIPGVGNKSAQRLILELKDKLKTEEIITTSDIKVKTSIVDNEKIEEAISALQVLGYTKHEIMKALENIDTQELSVEDIIRKGLINLSR